ncbi:hypothetical protein Cgig2_014114 [Carnegiea gigantea]|uniref:Uncharacterized protein n=1 Tax=Carnegiea gigantea TaxID=171969 RepID=A0A9Q1KXB4_9CARY|nr:hypothetical protein Cgig2_014114 [Carnegiea gigantea]
MAAYATSHITRPISMQGERINCRHCGKIGHEEANFYGLIGCPRGWGSRGGRGTRGRGRAQGEKDALVLGVAEDEKLHTQLRQQFKASGLATAPNPGCLHEDESSRSHPGPQDGPNSSPQPIIEREGAVGPREDQATFEGATPTMFGPRSDAAPRPRTSRDRGWAGHRQPSSDIPKKRGHAGNSPGPQDFIPRSPGA